MTSSVIGSTAHMQIFLGFLFAVVMAAGAYRARALDLSGAVAALIVGTVTFGIGGWPFALPLLTFFISSTLLSRWRKRSKEALGFEKGGRRDSGQVFANGGIATLFVLAYALVPAVSHHAYALFLAAFAEANADTWATEIGSAAGGTPVSIVTFKRVPIGMSGGISATGTLGLVAGAFVVALYGIIFHPLHSSTTLIAPMIGGIVGALVDSVLGATIQAQWRDGDRLVERRPVDGARPVRGVAWVGNDCVNFAGTAVAVATAWLLS